MTTLLNIAALSRRTGVAPDTLRKWEQRYGVLRPRRTEGGQRRYTEHDVARVEWLRDRLAEGWRIGEAARVLEETSAPPLDDPEALRSALLAALRADAVSEVTALLDQAFAVLPVDRALLEVAAPVLAAVGEAWHEGDITVAQEHAMTAKVRSRLEHLLADCRGSVRGTAVLACPPGELHDLGLLMLAVLMRADGWRAEYLGANTPVPDAVRYAEAVGARALCFSATRHATVDTLRAGLAEAGETAVGLVVGGAAVTPDEARALGATYADDDLQAAVVALRTLGAA